MSSKLSALIEKIHASPLQCSLVTTGAGGSAISLLMSVAGCSRTLLDGVVPYHRNAAQRILDHNPKAYVSREVGRDLAHHAYMQACNILADADGTSSSVTMGSSSTEVRAFQHIVGIGCTAAIQTDRTRKGQDALHVSSWTFKEVVDYTLVMSKSRKRTEQELVVAKVILRALADCAGVRFAEHLEDDGSDAFLGAPKEVSSEQFAQEKQDAGVEEREMLIVSRMPITFSPYELLLQQKARCVIFNSHGCAHTHAEPFTPEEYDGSGTIYLLYPGSFRPLHWGHTELVRVASNVVLRLKNAEAAARGEGEGGAKTQAPYKHVTVTYEISTTIVGKGALTVNDLNDRTRQFTSGGRRVAITCAKLFVEKAKMFPHHGLIMGVDTARRVIDPQFYNNSFDDMLANMKEIEAVGCYFVVGGRQQNDGTWDDLQSMTIPDEIRHMFKSIDQSEFRVDISSTELRAREKKS